MTKLIAQILASIIALRLAQLYMSGIQFKGNVEILIFAGAVLGLLNFFVKPILKAITLPLRILTLGFFSFIINIVIVYFVNLAFYELVFEGFWPMAWFIVLLWFLNLILYSILN